jgi:hypothetical protein
MVLSALPTFGFRIQVNIGAIHSIAGHRPRIESADRLAKRCHVNIEASSLYFHHWRGLTSRITC